MNRTEANKKVWDLVEADKIREAEEIAIEYNIEMCFGDNYIAVEDDVFISNYSKGNNNKIQERKE